MIFIIFFILENTSTGQPGTHAFGSGPGNSPSSPFGPRNPQGQPGLLGPPPAGLRPMLPPQANKNMTNQRPQNVPSFPPGYGEIGFDEDQIRSFIRENMPQGIIERRDVNNGASSNQGGPPQPQQQPPFRREDGPFHR